MTFRATLALLCAIAGLVACAEDPPPRTVTEFIDNPALLEAAVVRCSANRSATRYEAECVNAREAVRVVEAREEAARREELERRSAAQREALRQRQEAAAEARRRVAEAERKRREAEYLAQFGVPMPPDEPEDETAIEGNTPTVIIPDAEPEAGAQEPPKD